MKATTKSKDPLALAQINRRVQSLRTLAVSAAVKPGWIHYMRASLRMTLKQLAGRAGVALPTVAQAERNEAAGRVTIATLKKMADAMNCDLVYAFVPRTDIEDAMRQAARAKARQLLAVADTHMTLEDQKVGGSPQERIDRLAEKLLAKGDIW